MAITYKVVPKKNPQDLNAAPKYYAQVVVTGKDSTASIANELAQNSTMNRGEIVGFLTMLQDIISNRLVQGRSIDLLGLCDISPKISSSGADSEAKFNANTHILKIGINIRAKKKLVEAVAKAGVQRA